MQFLYHSDKYIFIETFDELVYEFCCKVTLYITILIMFFVFFTVQYTKNTIVTGRQQALE